MSEPIIRTGDIAALSQAVTNLSQAVGDVARQNKILAEANLALNERVSILEGRK